MSNFSADPYENPTMLEWFVRVQSISDMWQYHPTFISHELNFYVGGLVTLIHAILSGGRYKYLWLATVLHGLVVEHLVFGVPDMDNFWHAQGLLTFRGGRLPGNIIVLYPTYIYTATVAVSHLRLPRWIQPFTVGLSVVLMDMPYDIMGIKLLWWTWHDTDPNLHDRHYWVPWTSYYFHTTFAASTTMLSMLFRRIFVGRSCGTENDLQTGSVWRELSATILVAAFGMAGGVLQFIPFYHPLHDIYKVHSEVIVVILLLGIAFITWTQTGKFTGQGHKLNYSLNHNIILKLLVLFHYAIYILLVIFASPENSVVTGLHETTGPCNVMQPINTASGKVLYRKKYLCTNNYDEAVFDWHCLPNGKPPSDGLSWYTICGTPYENHAEYVVVVTAVCLLGVAAYWHMLSHPKFKETNANVAVKKIKKK
ncbi:hypothetical protein CHUAL_012654 [Chamberlinius hualienensis]